MIENINDPGISLPSGDRGIISFFLSPALTGRAMAPSTAFRRNWFDFSYFIFFVFDPLLFVVCVSISYTLGLGPFVYLGFWRVSKYGKVNTILKKSLAFNTS